ncbi:hypothetical protein [Neolewinella antarctica]|uniref:Uncharacterized protein n=1 Tax=Neolewinella antarctica TaxID=442734 RepID=A0ABX0X7M5_9BACT|nr:hypothetical protein [Neolewinella antarctica]NJC25147.1 hypothetical protein [Neolewinella antarctica]
MQILTVVIGLIFVLLLLSLLATTLMELLSSFFSLRARNLNKALRNMLASSDESEVLVAEFQRNSLYRHLTQQYGAREKRFAGPSYMNAETFQSILFDVILKGGDNEQLPERIAALPDEDLRNVLQQLYRQSSGNPDMFRLEVQNWYNNVMDRAAGWYKRYVQKILIFMGLGIAIAFNADTVALYDRLSNDPEALETIAEAAEQYVRAREAVGYDDGTLPPDRSNDLPHPEIDPDYGPDEPFQRNDYETELPTPADYGSDKFYPNEPGEVSIEASLDRINDLLSTEIAQVQRPLGLGWQGVRLRELTTYGLITKLLGFVLTALAISMGAPFWFDLLKKLVNIRSTGARPYENR